MSSRLPLLFAALLLAAPVTPALAETRPSAASAPRTHDLRFVLLLLGLPHLIRPPACTGQQGSHQRGCRSSHRRPSHAAPARGAQGVSSK